ncbi:MAG: SpoIVB peptidase S55 [Terracidiphilus sp.]
MAAQAALLAGIACAAQTGISEVAAAPAAPPPSTGGIYPLSQVHRGLMATAWTVFEGTKPEAMQVEILGVLRGARGPGEDMILARLRGEKPEYTGVVAGMSGSPVYVGDKLLGSLSFRIGQFSKEPIAGITPIAQMLEVRDIPVSANANEAGSAQRAGDGMSAGMTFQAMETPLVMSGFRPEAIALWQKKMAGTGMELVAAGGSSGSSEDPPKMDAAARASIQPGSAVSAQLVRGDLEIAATCTVTYVDPKQLLACGHPILQAGPVSLPMTTTDVVATLASPLNAFKIVNTGATIGAFTEDRDSAIRGVFGAEARMIPVRLEMHAGTVEKKLHFEVLDLPTLTPQAVMVTIYNSLLQTNLSTAETSYHVTGNIVLDGHEPAPLDVWAPAGEAAPPQLLAAMQTGEDFAQLYSNGTRQGAIRSINLQVEAIPRNVQVDLDSARIVSGDTVHAGDTVMVEATLRPWQTPAHNVRIPVTLPARLAPGNLRLLVSDGTTLDRALHQPRFGAAAHDLDTDLARARQMHRADRIYVSLLTPETQGEIEGHTLTGMPLSMANALEPMRAAQDASLNGESAVVAGQAPAGGALSGFKVLTLHIESGGGLH